MKILNITDEEYFSRPEVSSSQSKYALRSALHYKHNLENPPKASASQAFGTAVHSRILEPDKFFSDYVVMTETDKRTKAYKEALAELQPHQKPLTVEERDGIEYIYQQWEQLMPYQFLDNPQNEMVVLNEIYGMECRGKLDMLGDNGFLDLKTCQSAEPRDFKRAMYNFNYIYQAAFYSLLTGLNTCYFVAVENSAPWGIKIYKVAQDTLESGKILVRQALDTIEKAKQSGNYDGYTEEIEIV